MTQPIGSFEADHVSVLRAEAIEAVGPAPGQVVVDATFGAGGYTAKLLEAGATVIAFDRDPAAIAAGRVRFSHEAKLTLVEAPFDQVEQALGAQGVSHIDAIVFDFGVSSMQLDQGERGFSFQQDGPLDMRMGKGSDVAAFVNAAEENDLADVIFQYGEEKKSRRLAKLIVEARRVAPLKTTTDLATIAEKALGRGTKIHPATRLFQALRIFINDELGQIVRALLAAERLLTPGGRLVAVSFHSLEDRIVKRFLSTVTGQGGSASRHLPDIDRPLATFNKGEKAVRPSAEEIDANPRARSAILRSARRNENPVSDWSRARLEGLGVPPLVFSPLQQKWSHVS
ncbi:MAG: 16S rRNA (cytosine(1402)-N(4))-methyltransferase RsmH [Pseudomonadota bacterium]